MNITSGLRRVYFGGGLLFAQACDPGTSRPVEEAPSTGGSLQTPLASGGSSSLEASLSGGAPSGGGTPVELGYDWGGCAYDPALKEGIAEHLESAGVTSVALLTSLSTWNVPFESLRGIECLTNLEELSLSRGGYEAGSQVIDLAPVATLKSLSRLSLESIDFVGFEALYGLPLKYLGLVELGLDSLSPVARFTQLEMLELSRLSTGDLSPLAELGALQHLGLNYMPVSDFSPLSGLPFLGRLYLNALDNTDLRGVFNLPELTYLTVENSDFVSFSGLGEVPQLKTLRLGDCPKIESFDGLQNTLIETIEVTSFYSGYPIVSDLSALASVPSLQQLSLPNAAVSDVSPLAECHALKFLNLEKNDVVDLSPLQGLSLEGLVISYNPISSIEPLGFLSRLSSLSIEGLGLTSIEPLRGLPLQKLSGSGNSITDLSPVINDELVQLDLFDNKVVDLPEDFQGIRDEATFVDLRLNPLSEDAKAQLTRLCVRDESLGATYIWTGGKCNYDYSTP